MCFIYQKGVSVKKLCVYSSKDTRIKHTFSYEKKNVCPFIQKLVYLPVRTHETYICFILYIK